MNEKIAAMDCWIEQNQMLFHRVLFSLAVACILAIAWAGSRVSLEELRQFMEPACRYGGACI